MNHRLRTLAIAAFVVALISIAAVGLYRSLQERRRPAPLSLAEAVEAYRLEIEELLREDECVQAETRLRSARQLEEATPHVYHDLLGRALLGQPGRSDEAESAFREALRHDPRYEPARRNLTHLRARGEGPVAPPGSLDDVSGGEGLDLSRGRLYVRLFQNGELARLHRSFSTPLAEQMSLEALVEMQQEVVRRLGAETDLLEETVVPGPNFKIYTRTARFENHSAAIDFVVQLTEDRRIAGLEFRPSRRAGEDS